MSDNNRTSLSDRSPGVSRGDSTRNENHSLPRGGPKSSIKQGSNADTAQAARLKHQAPWQAPEGPKPLYQAAHPAPVVAYKTEIPTRKNTGSESNASMGIRQLSIDESKTTFQTSGEVRSSSKRQIETEPFDPRRIKNTRRTPPTSPPPTNQSTQHGTHPNHNPGFTPQPARTGDPPSDQRYSPTANQHDELSDPIPYPDPDWKGGGGDKGSDVAMLLQPETRPITQEQLVNEVKGIYAGLVMVEKKCVEICTQQAKTTTKLSNEQWQALIALHRTLLHEHHDFFLASQHPTASPALRRLATKYAMPARMWRHGIHSFLELLRHRLPDSLDHMLAFVYLAYSMMALLMESVPSFLETWIECLGDLARYRMAIEEVDLRDREIWSNVARMWYNKAADRSPNVGRIQHHLAVLARPNIVQQLFYYSKALVSVVPFVNARESVMLLYSPFLDKSEMAYQKYPVAEASLVTANGILFTRGKTSDFQFQADQFIAAFDGHISRSSKFKVQGPEMASSLIAALFDFGSADNFLWTAFGTYLDSLKALQETGADPSLAKEVPTLDPEVKEAMRKDYWKGIHGASELTLAIGTSSGPDEIFTSSSQVTTFAGPLLFKATEIVSQRIGDKNIVPYMHVLLAFLWSLAYIPGALIHIERFIPWSKVVTFLNTLGRSGVAENRIEREKFPQPLSGLGRQLPEDFPMRGLIWAMNYFVPDFFVGQVVDEDERLLELPSHAAPRAERCLWLGARIASLNRYFTLNVESKSFQVTDYALSLAPASNTLSSNNTRTLSGVEHDHDIRMSNS